MLTITIPGSEEYNEETNEFVTYKAITINLEHSLVSLSKWEAKWKKPFLTAENKTYDETLDYIKYMTITQNVDPNIYKRLSKDNIAAVNNYIADPMTATWFADEKGNKRSSREIITSEIIYYWMVALQIPFECQKWHLNRLLTLIRVCNIKNKPPKKMSKKDALNKQKSLNAARRAATGSTG